MTPITTVPTLITERLILDAHRREDFADLAAMWADPAVVRYIGGTPRSQEDSWGRLLRYIGHWQLLGYGYWAVREKVSGNYIGDIGFADFHREIDPALDTPEMGWVLNAAAQGKGYGTEALLAALAWATDHFPQGKTVCIISPENRPSLGLAKKAGFVENHRSEYHQRPVVVMQRWLMPSSISH
jgi:RimJ/RimL family protein N-acetyltransferase